jgi:hypothetical protein
VDSFTTCSPWAPLARVGAVSTLISGRVPVGTPLNSRRVAGDTPTIMPSARARSRLLLDTAGKRGSAGCCVHFPEPSLSTVSATCPIIRLYVQVTANFRTGGCKALA